MRSDSAALHHPSEGFAQVLRTSLDFTSGALAGFFVSVFPFRKRVRSKETFEGLGLGDGKLHARS